MLDYAYNWQFGKKTLWRFQNCKDIVCECHRTDDTGETQIEIQPGSAAFFETMPMTPYMAVNELQMSLRFPRFPQGVYNIVTSF